MRRLSKMAAVLTAGILSFAGVTGASANDTEGFFAGVRFGYDLADVDYSKNVTYNPNVPGVPQSSPSGSSMTAGDSANDGFTAFMGNVGYRTFLSDQMYLSGEVEGAVYSSKVGGVLRGTRDGVTDGKSTIPSANVFPGAWSVEKNHSLGFNARLGFVPKGLAFMGEGRSLYVISGVKWLNATFESAYDNKAQDVFVIRGVTRKKRNATPWLIGGGMEFGSSKNRFDVRIQYSSWDIDYATGDGATLATARLPHDFNVDEIGFSVGYTRTFNFM